MLYPKGSMRLRCRSGRFGESPECDYHSCFFFFQAEDGIRDYKVTGVQTCALPILPLGVRARLKQLSATPYVKRPGRKVRAPANPAKPMGHPLPCAQTGFGLSSAADRKSVV